VQGKRVIVAGVSATRTECDGGDSRPDAFRILKHIRMMTPGGDG
jgi:hypothetical protein